MEIPTATLTCPTCKGTGKQTLAVHGADGESDLPIRCVLCDGTGQVTQAKLDALKRFADSWCQCDGGGDDPYYVADGRHDHCGKHHWDCSRCGGIVQIG